ncbi:MAG: pyridoxal phosphate-dependent aminotransferase [Methanotrichaceae archaeon]|nr:pyridoxal phosphate-dependent aminotransferase [Methanotrichaceae archaeon]
MVSTRMSSIVDSPTMTISAMAKKLTSAGLDVIDLGVGEPDFDTPKHICDAACESIWRGDTHYTPSNGIAELRQAIAEKFWYDNHITVSSDDVIVTPGAKMAVFAAIQATMDEGDECVLIGPSWVSYEPCVTFAGGRVVWADVDEEFMPHDLAEFITDKTKLIIVNSPSNPTGSVLGADVLREIRDLVVDNRLYVISDEIYEKIIYDRDHISIGSLSGMEHRTITINGFSKAYAMTGWRLGYLTGPPEILRWVGRLQSHSTSHATTFVQRAGVTALRSSQEMVGSMVAEFRTRRDLMIEGLSELGMRCTNPGGAFYLFPDVSEYGGGDEFAKRMLSDALIAVTPGSAFGPGGSNFVRISYAASQERLKESLERMAKLVGA